MESSTFKHSSTAVIQSMEKEFGNSLTRSFFEIFDVAVLSDDITREPFISKNSHEDIKDVTTVEIVSWGRFKTPENWLIEYSGDILGWMEDASDASDDPSLNFYDWVYENDMGEEFDILLRYGLGFDVGDIKWARQAIAIQVADIMLEKYQDFSAREGI